MIRVAGHSNFPDNDKEVELVNQCANSCAIGAEPILGVPKF